MNKLKLVVILFVSGICTQAQDIQLTLKTVINYALENNISAKKSRLEIENGNYQVQEIRALTLPQLNVEAGLNNSPLIPKVTLPGEIMGKPGEYMLVAFGQKWTSSASATLTQNIFNQSIFTGLKAAKSTREFYIINNQLTEETLIEIISKAYYQIYQSKEMLKTIIRTEQNSEKLSNIIGDLYNNGLATKIDYDRIKVSLSNLKAKKQQLTNSAQLQENGLKFMIGMDLNTNIIFPDDTFEITGDAIFTEADIENRTEINLLKKQSELLNYKKKSILAEYYPSLAFFGNFNYQGVGQKFPWFKGKDDKVYWTESSTIGLVLKIPLFNGLATAARIKQAENSLKQTELNLEDTREAMKLSYKNAKTQTENSLITIKTQKENVSLAKSILDNIQNNYQNGLASLTDLLNAENALTEAENNYTTALLEYKLAEIELIKSQGDLKSLVK